MLGVGLGHQLVDEGVEPGEVAGEVRGEQVVRRAELALQP